jgi:CHASE3 domain sensor protein
MRTRQQQESRILHFISNVEETQAAAKKNQDDKFNQWVESKEGQDFMQRVLDRLKSDWSN